MLSHVKYRYSNFTRFEIIKILCWHPNVKNKIALNIICQKKYTMPFLLCFGLYTSTQYDLLCKIPKFLFYANPNKSKYYVVTQMLKENCSLYSLSEEIHNDLFYSVLEYIHQLNILSHVKYRNSLLRNWKKIEILSRHPNLKNKIYLNIICQKKYTMPYSTLLWIIYTNFICSLM